MALLLQKQQTVSRCSAQPRVALLRPQPLVWRSRRAHAVNVTATTKAPAQPVKITIQGRRLPVRGPDRFAHFIDVEKCYYILDRNGRMQDYMSSDQQPQQLLLLLLLLYSQQVQHLLSMNSNAST
jgi:hypothetical protein